MQPTSAHGATPTAADQIEKAGHALLDAADKLIAILDRIDGDADLEPGGNHEPSLAVPEAQASNIVWFRGTARDLEIDHQDEAEPPVVTANTNLGPPAQTRRRSQKPESPR